jgi:hypothetical protein
MNVRNAKSRIGAIFRTAKAILPSRLFAPNALI